MTRSTYPELTTDQMIAVDRLMIEDYKIDLIQMMENAGHCLSILARDHFFKGSFENKTVVVMAGSGGNGGGALVAARRMVNNGALVQVWLAKNSDTLKGVPGHQLEILQHLEVDIVEHDRLPAFISPDLIIDGIIGYSLKGKPRGPVVEMIQWANSSTAPILALDVPSGFNSMSGTHSKTIIHAAATMTLALPKAGLSRDDNAAFVGELFLADISVPPALYGQIGIEIGKKPIFAASEIVQIR